MSEIGVEQTDELRHSPHALAERTKAAALFRAWHAVRDLVQQAERLGDTELIHFLGVAQLLIEERAGSSAVTVPGLDRVASGTPS